MESFASYIKPLHVRRTRQICRSERATGVEIRKYSSLAGALEWLGLGVMPPNPWVLFFFFFTCNKLTRAKESNTLRRSEMLISFVRSNPSGSTRFIWPPPDSPLSICTFFDAPINVSLSRSYGQRDFITGLGFLLETDQTGICNVVHWASCKLRCRGHSSYAADILECTNANVRRCHVKRTIPSCI